MKRTWAEYAWPDWVPRDLRKQIEDFWCAGFGRSPDDWENDAMAQGAFPLGTMVRARLGYEPFCVGRYVHAWNNIGRLVFDDGTWAVVGTSGATPAEDWQTFWGWFA